MITRERRGKVSPLSVPKALLRQFFDNFKFKGKAERSKKRGMSRWDSVVRIVNPIVASSQSILVLFMHSWMFALALLDRKTLFYVHEAL